MVYTTTLLVDATDAVKTISDRLNILFNSGVLPNLVFELAIDCWNVHYICKDNYETVKVVVRNRVYRFVDKEPEENEEIICLIVSCIKDLMTDTGDIIKQGTPEDTSHLQFTSIDEYNNIFIKVIHIDDNDTEYSP